MEDEIRAIWNDVAQKRDRVAFTYRVRLAGQKAHLAQIQKALDELGLNAKARIVGIIGHGRIGDALVMISEVEDVRPVLRKNTEPSPAAEKEVKDVKSSLRVYKATQTSLAFSEGPVTRVVHCKKEDFDVYIGRPSEWGNPFKAGEDGTREEVLNKYREWLLKQPELIRKARRELRGKTLGCWCAPKSCHGDVLAQVADGLLGGSDEVQD